jgi:hypothetical protein
LENNVNEAEIQDILPKIHLSSEQKFNCFKDIYNSLLKLLNLIEEERGECKNRKQGNDFYNKHKIENIDGVVVITENIDISLWLTGFIYTLCETDKLCDHKLTKVLVKIYGLYDKNKDGEYNYKKMSHQEYKNQIMESRGIVKHLMDEEQKNIEKELKNK